MAKDQLKIFIGLTRAVNRINRESERIFRKYGLTTGQFAVLEALYHKGDLFVGEVQELILTTSGNIPVILRNLEKEGLLVRRQDPKDRRKFVLSLTPKGRDLIDRVFPENAAVIERLIDTWDAGEQRNLLNYMRKFGGLKTMSERKVVRKVTGLAAVDGAGVHLSRVLGPRTIKDFDPFLMLDSFDSTNPEDYIAGFPQHPHRGIETISYLSSGAMTHRDSLGNEDTITSGEVQWMTAGSGILHEERLPATPRMLGVQLWLNLPAERKMSKPHYRAIKREEIEEIPLEGGTLRLLAGSYAGHVGWQPAHLPLDYYAIRLEPGASLTLPLEETRTVFVFTLSGAAIVAGEAVAEKTAVLTSPGDTLQLEAGEGPLELLVMSSQRLDEPVAWGGPIVMNTDEELNRAFAELRTGTFLRDAVDYEAE